MQYVGVGMRAVAIIIDTVALMCIGYVIAMFTGGLTADGFSLQGPTALIFFAVAIGYFVVLEAMFGWTIGKKLTGLKVVKLEGGAPIDWQASILRNVLRVVDGLFFYLVGAILVWTSDKKQRLGDRVAGTVVVRASSA